MEFVKNVTKNKALLGVVLALLLFGGVAFGQSEFEPLPPDAFPPDQFYRAKVVEIQEELREVQGQRYPFQMVSLEIVSGKENGMLLTILYEGFYAQEGVQKLKEGETVVLVKNQVLDEVNYYIADKYRLPALGTILLVFFAAAVFFGGIRGFTSILGLAFTILILVKYIVPAILGGANPLMVSFLGSLAIMFISLYLAHGFNMRTSLALVSTFLTLGFSVFLAGFFVSFAKLFGMGSEAVYYLQFSTAENLDFRGLLLGAIIIGTLGVLDDITTSQTAAVEEIRNANPSLPSAELYRRGISVGREHIAALVNTLALAYAGAALPLFLLFTVYQRQPWWVLINGELIAEEIVRTLVGSVALVLAVPIATFFAAYFYSQRNNKI